MSVLRSWKIFQVLLLFKTLQISLLVLFRDDEHVHYKAVPHSIEDALADGLLQAIRPQIFDLDGDAVIVDREVRAVLLAKEVDAANGCVLVDLGHDLAVDAVGLAILLDG